ncbi:extracellular solute-binding protein, family 5 Middle [Anaerovirgula multivorans]|uniref:Extracellular solute-binding protein, family 5 Middle n=1 Tax=Anaerovirgula multivorans TaxID=312168 RepID=A0A239GJT4_9FIRM|nr:ABC transporter substrate-binding protein [Anaerovirgula multivorans]SNS68314.1 extracellular solute-binding protein, family 5 Middle [Anaerovirgula multivorans]
MTIVSPNVLIDGDFQTVSGIIGTGPYVYDKIVSGKYTRFVRNEDYWGEAPYYNELIVKYIPDSASRLKALKTGEIDLIYGSALLTYEEYQQAMKIDGIKGQMAESDTRAKAITLNASSALLSDLKVRQAIAYAIDKSEIAHGLTYGYEGIADIPFTLDAPYSDVPLNTTFTHDAEKANALLEEAGWVINKSTSIREKNGMSFSIVLTMDVGFDSLNKPLATLLKSQLSEVGIDLKIKSQEQMEWYADFVAGNFDITIWQPQYAYASPHCWFTPMSTMTPQTPSLANMSDAQEFFAAIEEFTRINDSDRLTEIFTYLINYDLDNVIDILLTYSKDMIVYNSEKIDSYDFQGVPCFFDVTQLKAK